MPRPTSLTKMDTITKIVTAIITSVVALIAAIVGIANYFKSASVQNDRPVSQSGTGIASGRDTINYGSIVLNPHPLNVGKLETVFSHQTGLVGRALEIGDSGAILNFTGPQGMPLFNLWGEDNLTLESVDGQIYVSTKIRDRKGNLITELIRNEWKVAPPPRSWDRNYSKDALEVRDETGRIVLQIRLLSDRVQLQGEWWRDETNGFGLIKGKSGARLVIFGTGFRREDVPPIEPMFLYPSESHLGELRKSVN